MTHAKAKVVYSHQGCQWGVEVMGKRLESDGKRWNCATAEVFAKGLNEILSAVSASATESAARRAAEKVREFARFYPEDVFIEPPKGEHGKTVDSCSARAIRTILPNVARDIEEEFSL